MRRNNFRKAKEMEKRFFTTKEAAAMIGRQPNSLAQAVYQGRVKTPEKVGRVFIWTLKEISEAGVVLRGQGRVRRKANRQRYTKPAAGGVCCSGCGRETSHKSGLCGRCVIPEV